MENAAIRIASEIRQNRLDRVVGRAEIPPRDRGGHDLADVRLYYRRLSAINQVNFGPNWIYADNLISLLGETSCGDRTDIT